MIVNILPIVGKILLQAHRVRVIYLPLFVFAPFDLSSACLSP
jgi:hypothetical protein